MVVTGSSLSVTGTSAPAFPNSAAFTVTTAGTYQWQAVFTSSNGQNNGATSPCGTETFTVGPNSPTLGTVEQYSTDSGSTFNNVGSNTVSIGNEVRDTASLSGAATPVAGHVVYTLYNGIGCANNAPTGSVVVAGSSQSVTGSSAPDFPNSAAFTVTTAGTYQWQAVFTSSNGQNNDATSPCGSETFLVGANSPTLQTVDQSSPDNVTFTNIGTSSVSVGDFERDSASLSGAALPVAGHVDYTLYNGTGCANNAPTGSVVFDGGSQLVTGPNFPDFPDPAAVRDHGPRHVPVAGRVHLEQRPEHRRHLAVRQRDLLGHHAELQRGQDGHAG